LADSRVFDRVLHWLVFECGDLPGAFRDVGESTEPLVLPVLQKTDPNVVEYPACQLVVVEREMRRVSVADRIPVFRGRVVDRLDVHRSVVGVSASGGVDDVGVCGFVGGDHVH
jgi:hypothetical protein